MLLAVTSSHFKSSELRLKAAEGIARVFYCTMVGKKIVMLHQFIKKTDKTPTRELAIARKRMKEVKNAHP
jgi:phage-related protein